MWFTIRIDYLQNNSFTISTATLLINTAKTAREKIKPTFHMMYAETP